VTSSLPIIPDNAPANTTAVVSPSYNFEVVRVGFEIVNCRSGVDGKTAVMTPESAEFVATAPATVKKSAGMPVSV